MSCPLLLNGRRQVVNGKESQVHSEFMKQEALKMQALQYQDTQQLITCLFTGCTLKNQTDNLVQFSSHLENVLKPSNLFLITFVQLLHPTLLLQFWRVMLFLSYHYEEISWHIERERDSHGLTASARRSTPYIWLDTITVIVQVAHIHLDCFKPSQDLYIKKSSNLLVVNFISAERSEQHSSDLARLSHWACCCQG